MCVKIYLEFLLLSANFNVLCFNLAIINADYNPLISLLICFELLKHLNV